VDAPATGHSLQYLRMPQTALHTFGAGLVRREATRVVGLLQDVRRTTIHIVTLGEDMPVSETLEMHGQLTGELAMPVGRVVVNRVHSRIFDEAPIAALRRAAAEADERDAQLLGAVAAVAEEESGWAGINAEHVERLRDAVGQQALVLIPFLFREEFGAAEIDEVSRVLEQAFTPVARSEQSA
jgi:anion-transporting  ArsA/GET3 family ATPase